MAHPEFRATDVVRWQLLDVPIDGLPTDEALIDRVVGAIDDARSAAQRSIVARVRLTGRGPLHRTLQRAGVRGDVLREARERLGEAEPFAWVESVRDETRPEVDLDERRLADDFFGDVLRRVASAREAVAGADPGGAAELPSDVRGVLNALYANERARRYLRDREPSAADARRLLDGAEAVLADRLAGEG